MSNLDNIGNKCRIVLCALLEGVPVEYDGQKYVMCDDYELCIEADKSVLKKGRIVDMGKAYLKTDFSLRDFIKLVEKMDSDQVYLIGCNNVLTQINRK